MYKIQAWKTDWVPGTPTSSQQWGFLPSWEGRRGYLLKALQIYFPYHWPVFQGEMLRCAGWSVDRAGSVPLHMPGETWVQSQGVLDNNIWQVRERQIWLGSSLVSTPLALSTLLQVDMSPWSLSRAENSSNCLDPCLIFLTFLFQAFCSSSSWWNCGVLWDWGW